VHRAGAGFASDDTLASGAPILAAVSNSTKQNQKVASNIAHCSVVGWPVTVSSLQITVSSICHPMIAAGHYVFTAALQSLFHHYAIAAGHCVITAQSISAQVKLRTSC
jgi:hypothetical protein